jgi:hypothetical protein
MLTSHGKNYIWAQFAKLGMERRTKAAAYATRVRVVTCSETGAIASAPRALAFASGEVNVFGTASNKAVYQVR